MAWRPHRPSWRASCPSSTMCQRPLRRCPSTLSASMAGRAGEEMKPRWVWGTWMGMRPGYGARRWECGPDRGASGGKAGTFMSAVWRNELVATPAPLNCPSRLPLLPHDALPTHHGMPPSLAHRLQAGRWLGPWVMAKSFEAVARASRLIADTGLTVAVLDEPGGAVPQLLISR